MFIHLLAAIHPLIPLADAGIKQSQDAGRAIALGVGAGGGAAGAGAGIGAVFNASIQAKTRQPELRDDDRARPVARLRAHRGVLLLRPRRRLHRVLPVGRDARLRLTSPSPPDRF